MSACADLADGNLAFSVHTWSSSPSEEVLRLGAIAGNVVDASRETYVSIVVTRASGANVNDPVSLAGVTLPFQWSRAVAVEDEVSGETTYEPRPKEEFVFACWGGQILPKGSSSSSNEGRNDVSCEEISLTMDDVGPRVTFGANVVLLPGEFLVGGYSNFLFSFKHVESKKIESLMTLRAPVCDVEAMNTLSSSVADYDKFLVAMINYDLLPRSVVADMETDQYPDAEFQGLALAVGHYGLGNWYDCVSAICLRARGSSVRVGGAACRVTPLLSSPPAAPRDYTGTSVSSAAVRTRCPYSARATTSTRLPEPSA